MIRIGLVKNPFAPLTKEYREYPEQMTVAEALAENPMPDHLPFVCVVNGLYVLRSDNWHTYMIPMGGQCLFIAAAQGAGGGGKKNPLATILMLVVVAALSVVTAGAASPLATALSIPLAAAKGILAVGSALVLAGASYLINMALPPSFAKPPEAPDPAYSIVGRSNQARLGAPIEVGYGRLKFYPSLCAAPYREYSDTFVNGVFNSQTVGDQTLFEIYHIGWGYYDVETYDLINQDLASFPEAVIQKFEPGEQITSFPSSVYDVPAVSDIYLEFPLGNKKTTGQAYVTVLYTGSPNVNEIQRITVENYASGSFRLSLAGISTGDIPFPTTSEDVRSALQSLSNVGNGNVRCTGGPLTPTESRPIVVEFIRDLSKTPLSQMVLNKDDLEDASESYPNWGTIHFGGFNKVVSSGVSGGVGFLEADEDLGIDDGLVGMLVGFLPSHDDTPGRASSQMVFASIKSNTGSFVYWDVPAPPTTLRDGLDRAFTARYVDGPGYVENGDEFKPDGGGNCYYQIVELKNWKGPFKVNPNESTDPINEIALDFAIPSPRYIQGTDNQLEIPLGWRAERQALDDDGEPYGPWAPITTNPVYIYADRDPSDYMSVRFDGVSNIYLNGVSTSPTRFTVKVPATEGRYQVRVANCFLTNSGFGPTENEIFEGYSIPSGYAPNREVSFGDGNFADMEDETGVFGKSYWMGLRGYATRTALRWPGRTVVTLRITATDNVNANTLQQFGVTATRKLQDYVAAVDSGTLPEDPFTTTVFTGVRIVGPEENPLIPVTLKTSVIAKPGIGPSFKKGEYVRLSGFAGDYADNNGEFLVLLSSDNTLKVRGNLVTVAADNAYTAGSRRVYSDAPTIVSGVAVNADGDIESTGIGLLDDFPAGGKVTLAGFVDARNNHKFTIVSVTDDTLVVDGTLYVEASSADTKAHSTPPNGLVGALLDGARVVFDDAEAVGGIGADAINTVVVDNVAVTVSSAGVTKIVKTGIGSTPQAVVGALVTLGGFTEKRNQETVVITDVGTNDLTVTLVQDNPDDPVPTLSSLVAEAAATGKTALFGARKITLCGDTKFYFYADQGATSAATGGGTVTYDFPNEWSELQPSQRISSAEYDLATDNDFGGGSDPSRVDTEGMRVLETTWDSRDRYEPDGITWKESPVKDVYNARLSERKRITVHQSEMARCGRARVMYPSGKLTLIRDEPRAVADAMYVGRGNIIENSLEFVATFPTDDTPDHVLVQFFNEEFWDFDEVVCTFIPYSLSQVLVVRRTTEGGTFTLTHNGETTDPIDESAGHADIETALNALPSIAVDSFDCSGNPKSQSGMTITYKGPLLGKNVQLITVDDEGLGTGAAYIAYNVNPAWPGVAPARLVMPGVTKRHHAWREGMYELGSSNSRRMLVTMETDVEGYIPSYLSRIDISDEIGSWGQHGIVTGYEVGDTTSSIFVSEHLDWSADGTYVIQLRDKMGKPITEGLTAVTQGAMPNEVVMTGAFDTELIGLHTDHLSGREATFFSFGIVDQHSLKLLVTGIRPTSYNRVMIEGYIYKVEGVYDVDGDLEYIPPDESEVLDARQLGGPITGLSALLVQGSSRRELRASWAPAPWARHYLVETSFDGFAWNKVTKTVESSAAWEAPNPLVRDQYIEEGFTCGTVLNANGLTRINRNTTTEPTDWVNGAYNGMFVAFTSGVYAGQRFAIANSNKVRIVLREKLEAGQIVDDTDTFDIVNQALPVIYVGVRGYNDLYGPRSYVTVDLNHALRGSAGPGVVGGGSGGGGVISGGTTTITPSSPSSDSTGRTFASSITTESWRLDYYGNLFLSGKMFDGDHPNRLLFLGAEPRYDGADLSVAYLPSEPRVTSGRDALLVFLQDLPLEQVSSSPGEGQFVRSGTTIQLGFDRVVNEALHFIMVSANDDSETLGAIQINGLCTFSGPTNDAVLPFTPERPEEVLLFLNSEMALFPVDSSPGDGEFTLSGTAIVTGTELQVGDRLVCLGLAQGQTTEADRFHIAPFTGDMVPYLPLFPAQVALAQGGSMRWNGPGAGNFRFDPDASPQTVVLWGDPEPTEDEARFAILMRAKA